MRRRKRRAKTCSRSPPKISPARPQTSQNRCKMEPELVWGSIWQPRGAQEHQTCAQEATKRRPRAPKSGPREAKSRPSGTREAPKPLPNRPRCAPGPHSRALLAESSVQEAVGTIFARFLCRAPDGRHAFRISFNGVSCTSSMFRIACSRARKNIEK